MSVTPYLYLQPRPLLDSSSHRTPACHLHWLSNARKTRMSKTKLHVDPPAPPHQNLDLTSAFPVYLDGNSLLAVTQAQTSASNLISLSHQYPHCHELLLGLLSGYIQTLTTTHFFQGHHSGGSSHSLSCMTSHCSISTLTSKSLLIYSWVARGVLLKSKPVFFFFFKLNSIRDIHSM